MNCPYWQTGIARRGKLELPLLANGNCPYWQTGIAPTGKREESQQVNDILPKQSNFIWVNTQLS